MYRNKAAERMKKQNMIRSKTQSFILTYQESSDRVKSVSTINSLAKSIYSARESKKIFGANGKMKSKSHSLINPQGSETHSNSTIKALTMRASYIPNFSNLNTQLLLQKRRFEQKIYELQYNIQKQSRILSKTQTNCKNNQNLLQNANNSLQQLQIKSERLNLLIDQTRVDCNQLKVNLRQLSRQNGEKNQKINAQTFICQNLSYRSKTLKNTLLIEQKNKNLLKNQLIKDQKSMNSSSINLKQLQHQKAVFLLQINKSVAQNMIN